MKTEPDDIITDCNLEGLNCGLTKREHFAGLAMASFFGGEFIGQSGIDDKTIAKRCVSMADALIEELNNTAKP